MKNLFYIHLSQSSRNISVPPLGSLYKPFKLLGNFCIKSKATCKGPPIELTPLALIQEWGGEGNNISFPYLAICLIRVSEKLLIKHKSLVPELLWNWVQCEVGHPQVSEGSVALIQDP